MNLSSQQEISLSYDSTAILSSLSEQADVSSFNTHSAASNDVDSRVAYSRFNMVTDCV